MGRYRSTVISFNYDMLLEAAAKTLFDTGLATDERYKFEARDFERGPLVPLASRTGYAVVSPGKYTKRGFSLLKLHGSTSWYWSGPNSGPDRPVYSVGPQLAWGPQATTPRETDLDELINDLVPCIIPPTTSKAGFYSSAFFISLWRSAEQALRVARCHPPIRP